jgi:hypothetical protein
MPGYSDDPSRYRRLALAFAARADATRDSNLQAKFRQIAARYHALAEELDDMAVDKALMLRAHRARCHIRCGGMSHARSNLP